MLLLVLLLIFGPIPFLILGVASLYALVTVGLPIVAALLLVWLSGGHHPLVHQNRSSLPLKFNKR